LEPEPEPELKIGTQNRTGTKKPKRTEPRTEPFHGFQALKNILNVKNITKKKLYKNIIISTNGTNPRILLVPFPFFFTKYAVSSPPYENKNKSTS
jgi:hypothetical protein